MKGQFRLIHFLNQFFAGIGGEEKANLAPCLFDGARGPGNLLQTLCPDLSITATIVVGDNFIATHTEEAVSVIIQLLQDIFNKAGDRQPQLLVAGPAFNAGRYGFGCGMVCRAVREEFRLPVVAGMFTENPAVDQFKKELIIIGTGRDVMSMQDALSAMGKAAMKIFTGEELLPEKDGTIPQGLRKNYFSEKSGAVRAIEMLLAKVTGKPFVTEYEMPTFDRVEPAPAIDDIAKAKVALVTSGGIVPRGNPDRIEAASAGRFGSYSIEGVTTLDPQNYQTAHGGYDPTYANEDPNRVLPLDVVREFEAEGVFGSLHETYYATVGNGTSVEKGRKFGHDIAQKLLADGVQAVILTST